MAKANDVQKIHELRAVRTSEDLLVSERDSRTKAENVQDWKRRQEGTRDLYAGDWVKAYPGQFKAGDKPKITNLVQAGLDDIKRLVKETRMLIEIPRGGSKKSDLEAAKLERAIARSYWVPNRSERRIPAKLALDLGGTGGAFLSVWPGESDYPEFTRLHPAGVYPSIVNDTLIDLLVITPMKVRQAMALYPGLRENVRSDPELNDIADSTDCEVLDFYERDKITKAVLFLQSGTVKGGFYLSEEENPLEELPIAWGQMETLDDAFRGLFDQIDGTMLVQNTLVEQMTDYGDQLVYAPIVAKDVINDEDPPSPTTIYRLGPEGEMRRLEPAGSHPQLYALLEYLERQGRAGAGYPATRHGEVSQSIASAAFVQSTMGQLTTTVRDIGDILAYILGEATRLAFKIDRLMLNRKKQLLVPYKDQHEYSPKADIRKEARPTVRYGVAGLDYLAKSQKVQSDFGLGLVSKETARKEIVDYVDDDHEEERIQREMSRDVLFQKLLQEGDIQAVLELVEGTDKGEDLSAIARKLIERRQQAEEAARQAAALAAQQGPEPVPGEEEMAVPPPEGDLEDIPLQEGGEPTDVNMPLPPMSQVIVRPPGQ